MALFYSPFLSDPIKTGEGIIVHMRKILFMVVITSMMIASASCSKPWQQPVDFQETRTPEIHAPTHIENTSTPSQVPTTQPTVEIKPKEKIWLDPILPAPVVEGLVKSGQFEVKTSQAEGVLRASIGPGNFRLGIWIFSLSAPFPTLVDNVSLDDLKAAWRGKRLKSFADRAILVDPSTKAVFESLWGKAAQESVQTMPATELLSTAWANKSWAILPFESLLPSWKVLRVDGLSPFDRNLNLEKYPLAVPLSLSGEDASVVAARALVKELPGFPWTNRDEKKMTTLIMTGVTALVRGTAWYMEKKGILFPGRDIRSWLLEADITHISNEISFNPDCPFPDANDPSLRFCSSPKYIQLLEDVGADIIELTGNHLNDYGKQWLPYTIDLYKQKGWGFYGAGLTEEQAREPLLVEHNGNRLAFIGCNPNGPQEDWATQNSPGAWDCDYPAMEFLEKEIQRLKKEGCLPIVTFQYFESYDPVPLPIHYRDFRRMSDAGAVIVSGSQAHLPQAMELRNNGFIHYGLGNLFFDQMDTYWPDTKDEFIDRHVFYDGKYLGTELLTARLEEYVKPRPMTSVERETLLRRIYSVSGWTP